MALRHCGFAESVIAFDVTPGRAAAAVAKGAACEASPDLAGLRDADAWILAAPPRATISLIPEVVPHVREDAIVMDCASVKAAIEGAVPDALHTRFVGSHPMAGRAQSGLDAADPELFEGAPWVVCPHPAATTSAVRRAENIIFGVGAIPMRMSAQDHDRHVALQSHLPHVLAAALVQMKSTGQFADVSAGSWSDLTRVAGADPVLWREIWALNGGELAQSLEELIKILGEVRAQALAGDELGLEGFMRTSLTSD
jgi:prephenate dehydrogenase